MGAINGKHLTILTSSAVPTQVIFQAAVKIRKAIKDLLGSMVPATLLDN